MPVRKPSSPAISATILLVDHNANGLKARKSVLEESGYKIVTAACGHDALELVASQKFDLLVTGYMMPVMNGIELIRKLRESEYEAPIILVSGYADTLGLSEENTKANAVIQKSANEVSHLQRTVARLLRLKKPPRSEKTISERAKVKRKMV